MSNFLQVFPAKSILKLNGEYVSDHSRSPLSVSFEQIENANRTVKGDLRVYEIAKKHMLSTSWALLPSRDEFTVDGYMGGLSLYNLYMRGGEIRVEVWTDKEAEKIKPHATLDMRGRVKGFNYEIVKRNLGGVFYDFWNVDIELEEI